jgi:hypothetical protein
VDGEVLIGEDWVYVDAAMRPDLDVAAVLNFTNQRFVVLPEILRDGVVCGDCVASNYTQRKLSVQVNGFSNYSLIPRRDFVLRSDINPELRAKVYQVVDLGDLRRDQEYGCIVQIHARDDTGKYVLVQTNPERSPQKLLRSPDENLPESVGYFKTHNGVANVYFRGDYLAAYQDFEYVVMCSKQEANSTVLVYEERIRTDYSPAGRGLLARSRWLVSEDNPYFVFGWVVLSVFGLWVVVLILRSAGLVRR